MQKFYPFKLLAALLLMIINLSAFGQELSKSEALDLVGKNSDRLNLSKSDVENSLISNAFVDKVSQIRLVYLQQAFNGIPVYNTMQVIAFKNGQPVSVSGERIYKIGDQVDNQKAIPVISAKEAIFIAAADVNIPSDAIRSAPLTILKTSPEKHTIEFDAGTISRENISTELMWVPAKNGKIRLGWQVKIVPKNTTDYWMIRVDAREGSIIDKDNLTVTCDWGGGVKNNVVPTVVRQNNTAFQTTPQLPLMVNSSQYYVVPYPAESMNQTGGTPVLVSNPWLLAGAGNDAISLNWHNDGATEYNYTRGNNVWAKDDIDGNNTGGSSAISSTALPDLVFNFPFDNTKSPGSLNNRKLAITNLFYWNNIMHDLTYQYGFDEAAGNFQNNNLSRGGMQNDYVIADAQDGGGRNNANFSTGADGYSPRMQMYLFDGNPYEKLYFNLPYNSFISSIEGELSTNNLLKNKGAVTGDLVMYNDDVDGTTHFACNPPANGAELAGKIVVIDREVCNYTSQVKNAQNAGAIGVLIINSVPGSISVMKGSDNTITIPALMIFQSTGNWIKATIPGSTMNVTLKARVDRDGDLDNEIITHEYTHGISTRLTGGSATATCLTNNEQMGEGWSDFFALMATTDWSTAAITDGNKSRTVGNYATDQDPVNGRGIRTYPYTTDMTVNPWTYGKLKNIEESEEHEIGECWTAALWDMTWNMIQEDGINSNLFNAQATGGNSAAMKIVTLGMKLQPCNPGFLDGRDAILKADEILYNGKYRCAIWNAFSRRGMGIGAKQGSAFDSYDQVENFDSPSGASIRKSVDMTESVQNGELNYTFTVAALCDPVNDFKVVDTLPSNVTYKSGGVYNPADHTVTFAIPDLMPLETASFHLQVTVKQGTFFASSDVFSETVPDNSIPSTLVGTSDDPNNKWHVNSEYYSTPYSLISASPATATEQILSSVSPVFVADHMQLSFWHKYNTEPGKDGGVVELSVNGSDWFDAAPYIVSNGYNSIIHTNSSLDGKPAFSGINTSFSQTVINLSAFHDQPVYFRFRYVTDTQNKSDGWVIDDILVKKMAAVYNIAKIFDNSNSFYALADTITAISSVVLPVTWDNFTAQKDGDHANLRWSTKQEFNTDKFYVERCGDGIHFLSIASVEAAGNKALATNYSISDESPLPGNNFYRIRLIDKDGRTYYTETKLLFFDVTGASGVRLSPNPAKSTAELFVPGNRLFLNVQLIDATGRILQTFDMRTEKLKIELNSLSAGVYYVRIKGKNLQIVKKLVKER